MIRIPGFCHAAIVTTTEIREKTRNVNNNLVDLGMLDGIPDLCVYIIRFFGPPLAGSMCGEYRGRTC